MPTDAVRRLNRVIGQDHQTELVRQFADRGAIEARQEDAFLDVVFHDPPARRRRATLPFIWQDKVGPLPAMTPSNIMPAILA